MNRAMTAAAIVLLMLGSRAAAHDEEGPHDDVFKISKSGEVKFDNDVRFGEDVIKKGKYLVADRAEGAVHVLVFTTTGQKNAESSVVREIRMRWIPAKDPVNTSAVIAEAQKDHSYRVKTVQIAGEPGDHVPESAGAGD